MHTKRIIIISLCILAVAIAVWFLLAPHTAIEPLTTTPNTISPLQATTSTSGSSHSVQLGQQQTPTGAINSGEVERVASVAASTTYTIPVSVHESVIVAMQSLASTTSFSFTTRSFPSLGLFVESIDGISNANGKYWMLYINGTLSPVGASSAVVSPNDVVQWKYQ